MQKFKSILFILVVFVASTAMFAGCKKQDEKTLLQTIKDRNKIVVGVKLDSKPFGFIDNDQQLKGFDIDLSKEIAKRILGDENSVEFKQVNSSNRILMLSSGAIDMIVATMTITEKRRQVIDFSEPYYFAGQAVMIPQNSDIKTIKDLNNKRVIVVLGSTSEQNIRTLAPNAQIKGFRTYTEAYSSLKAGRADAMTTDDVILAGFIMEDKSLRMLKERYTTEPYGIGFRKDPKSAEFQALVDETLAQIKADGTLKRINQKWMSDFVK
jgi:putative glutamine transport system substrate-binding protein